MADQQNERAVQKQFGINLNRKVKPGIVKKKLIRRYRDIALGLKTPRDAIEGTYGDKKYPFTGNVRIRGRISLFVRPKCDVLLSFARKFKRHRNMSVHCSPAFRDVKIGDIVTIGECRPLSKTVRFKGQGAKKS